MVEMTIFELVKVALDQLYADAEQEYDQKVDTTIIKRLAYLSDSYSDLHKKDREPVDYRDLAVRFAYVYKYVAAHGDYIVQVLQELYDHLGCPIFKGKTLRVSCVGGGPGSDLIAVLKYLNESSTVEPVNKVIFYLLDQEQAWADAWTELGDILGLEVGLNTNFQPLDVTDPDSWQHQKKCICSTPN